MPRLFVAVWPPDDVLALIAALPRPEVEGLRWTTRDQWHVTLRFFGSVELEEASAALAQVSGSATTAVLGPETGRFAKRVLHVPVDALPPAKADAAVIPHPSNDGGEVPKAFVVARGDVSADELIAFVAERVAPYKRVRLVEFVDQIPKSASGKILRRILIEQERARAAGEQCGGA